MDEAVKFIAGDVVVDDRGGVVFCNAFDMKSVRRFYKVFNHRPEFIRAWHGHKNESKFILVTEGSAIVAAVQVKDWKNPDANAKVERYVLSEKQPGVLFVPGGYAHGYKTLKSDTSVLFFSTATLEQSVDDDYRFDAYFWNPWKVVER